MNGVPSYSKESKTVTMPGCESEPASRDSRTHRLASASRSACTTVISFNAISRSSSGWGARWTVAMPPRPISCNTS